MRLENILNGFLDHGCPQQEIQLNLCVCQHKTGLGKALFPLECHTAVSLWTCTDKFILAKERGSHFQQVVSAPMLKVSPELGRQPSSLCGHP